MEIKLYNTSSNNNVLNKVLTDGKTFNIKLKNDTEIIGPVIILKSDVKIDSNYAYIPEFERYYYIENISINSCNIYTLHLKCDVLMSFKDDILNSESYITSSNKNINPYYNSNYHSEVRKEVDIYKSNIILEDGTENILVTIGGSKE